MLNTLEFPAFLDLLVLLPLGFLVKFSFEFLMDTCSLYSALIHLDLKIIFYQDSVLALTKFFSLKKSLDLDLDLDIDLTFTWTLCARSCKLKQYLFLR